MTWQILHGSRSFLPSDVIDDLLNAKVSVVGLEPRYSYMPKIPDFEALDPMLGRIFIDDLRTRTEKLLHG